MRPERTPEEKAQSRAIHAGFQVAGGVGWVVCALMAGAVLLSGRGDAPGWLFGRARPSAPSGGRWTNRNSAVAFADWGPEPFARARREGKLVLLFIGPEFSAPTKRMEAEVFGDKGTALFVEKRFVPVRVDAAEFPDLDRRYRARGWPTTALLTPEGVVVDAGGATTKELFGLWAKAVADRAAERPEALARAVAEAEAKRREDDARRDSAAAAAPGPADARVLQTLLSSWDPARRTFDREGPRFPRFERVAALAALPETWARDLAAEAAKGTLIFQDPRDGGFRRAAAPDGTVIAQERVAADQAAALDALCALEPEAARRELVFLSASFAPKDGPARYHGWQAGYALTKDFHEATDGPDWVDVRREGWWPLGNARLGDDSELARAVLDCRVSPADARAHASAVVRRAARDFDAAAKRRDPRLLLDDALGIGGALLAAGRAADAARVRAWLEASLADGPRYLDRLATGVLPPETDRLADPALNARALAFLERLAAALPPGAARDSARARAGVLRAWLARRSDRLDPAVWASLNPR
jgi:hypothetical protein